MAVVVFRNGSIFDGFRHRTGQAVVVDGDRIRAVVGESELATLDVADETEVDLAGGLLLPGFVDAHVHPVQGGLERVRCDLSEAHTREDYLRIV
ncbi:MAG: amidohydrolase family protein, partial [Nocardioides sp.]